MRHVLAMFIAAFGLAFAAVAPASAAEAYAAQTGEGQYVVIFRGDRSTNRREVAEKAMLRAAQVTLESGNEWFMVTQTTTQRINLSTATALGGETDRAEGAPRDVGAGQGSGAGATGGGGNGNSATAGADPGAVGVGTNVDPRLLERRPRRMGYQTILMIRVGRRGTEVVVENPTAEQQIFDAASVASSLSASSGGE